MNYEFGVIRHIDALGRIVIPIDMRNKYKINLGDKIAIIPTEQGILIKNINQTEK